MVNSLAVKNISDDINYVNHVHISNANVEMFKKLRIFILSASSFSSQKKSVDKLKIIILKMLLVNFDDLFGKNGENSGCLTLNGV